MGYISNADIEERLGTASYVQLTDDTGTGEADADKVDEARLGAEGEVDSYLARRYAVPIDVTSHPELAGLLRSIALDLAEFRLHCRRPPVSEDVLRKRDATISWLSQVARGAIVLPSASALPANEAEGFRAAVAGRRRVLTDDEMQTL